MKTAGLSAVLLVGSLSVVAAAPGDNEPTGRVSYNDHDHQRQADRDAAARHDDWVELATPTPANHGREFISVDGGRYARLRIDAARGRPTVKTVRIEYKDGKQKIVRLDQTLGGKRSPSAMIELRGVGEITQIVVDTDATSRGAYTVLGEQAHVGVATR